MKRAFIYFFTVSLFWQCAGQQIVSSKTEQPFQNPKLVVGIVVDQMRYDYLTRFWERYGNGGFKRLVSDGYNCKNNHYNYVPTYTGPGHASIFTGTTPSVHGIIANNWFSKAEDKMVYCAEDRSVNTVGTTSDAEKMSPQRLKTTTVADQNRLHTQLRGKTIGVSIKDRGAILPAGHTANGAFWFRGKDEGNWVTTDFYMNSLPTWVTDFNVSRKVDDYMKPWETLYPITSYTESGADDNSFEGLFKGEEKPTFPHNLPKFKKYNANYDVIKATAFGNSLTADFAMAAIKGEKLGKDDDTDFLTLSFSSTDYVGHRYGVNSKEVEDTYLRLDKDLERFLNFLDIEVGDGNYTIFLTADHGAVQVPAYLSSLKIPAGYFDKDLLLKEMKMMVAKKFNSDKVIKNISNGQVFFDHQEITGKGIALEELKKSLVSWLRSYPQVDKVFTSEQMIAGDFEQGISALIQQGYHQRRSGDLIYVLDPATIVYSKTGSTHGSGLNHDTHVPLLFFGKGIKKGSTTQKTKIVDIAPTISSLLGIAFPNGTTGNVISEVID